jgi:hypothetical protein
VPSPEIGELARDNGTPPPEFKGPARNFNASCQVLRETAILSHRVNAILEFMDPDHYEEAKKVREEVEERMAGIEAIGIEDPLVYEGRELLFNRESGVHRDSQDPPLGYAILAALGDSRGARIRFPHLGLTVRMDPGDIVAIRGRIVPHEVVGPWTGQRISVPYFTHSSLWRALKKISVFQI